jgi:hypothetical protein
MLVSSLTGLDIWVCWRFEVSTEAPCNYMASTMDSNYTPLQFEVYDTHVAEGCKASGVSLYTLSQHM